MSNVVELPIVTRLDLDPQRVLAGAMEDGMTEVVIIGYDKDGDEVFRSSLADGADALWHLERAKLKLLRVGEA